MTDPIVTIQQGRSTWQGPESAIPLHLLAADGRKAGDCTRPPEGTEAVSGALCASGDLVSREAAIAAKVVAWSRELWADQRAHDVAKDLATLIEDLATNLPRQQTGAMQVGDDWPGIFIRGDHALMMFAPALRAVLRGTESELHRATVKNLIDLLRSCDARPLSALEGGAA